jgi:hypothetical protein
MILNHARLPFRHTRGLPRGERRDLNPRPLGPQPSALPTELRSPQYLPNAPTRVGRCSGSQPSRTKARLGGFEPPAHGLEVRCSIQLSYRRIHRLGHQNADQKEAGDGNRTRDKRLGRPMLYHLSYTRPFSLLLPPTQWSGREDLNLRPPAPKAGALPGCATSRQPHSSGFGRESIAYRLEACPRARMLKQRSNSQPPVH